ncbi:MAG: hypothetical protein NDI61_01265 [Bdellovibrionaceae bacterium]|nr:hypothetical protein [Pseudobdellovibrionaceae bacterium]
MKISSTLKWCLIFLFAFGQLDVAEAARKRRVRKKKTRTSIVYRIHHQLDIDWLNGASLRSPTDSTYNPGNLVFETESSSVRTDLNLDYRAKLKSRHKLVVRPRAYYEYFHIETTEPTRSYQADSGRIDLIEGFAESWLNDSTSVTLGLQSFQWGPAEILAPSNPLYHFSREQRSLLWREKGRTLARLNWTPSAAWSHVAIVEPMGNGEPTFIADRDFTPKALIKSEYRSMSEAQNYVGVTGGFEEEAKAFAGLYFNWMPIDGLSFYSDARVTKEPFRYVPEARSFLNFDMRESATRRWEHLGVYGIRWETEAADMRLEVIVNPGGYSETQFQQALLSTLPFNPNATTNASRLTRSGYELFGRYYGYLSLRFPDLGEEGLWTAAVRYFHSEMDASGVASFAMERPIGDNFVLLGEGRHAVYKKDAEFGLQEKYYLFLGLRTLL